MSANLNYGDIKHISGNQSPAVHGSVRLKPSVQILSENFQAARKKSFTTHLVFSMCKTAPNCITSDHTNASKFS